METTVAPPASFVERRRPYPAPHRGLVLVERRRPAPEFLHDIDDLHDVDLDGVLAEQLAYGVSAAQAAAAAQGLAALIGADAPTALLAHDLSRAAGTFTA